METEKEEVEEEVEIVRRDLPILISLKNAWNNHKSHIQVIIYHKPSSDFTISHVKLSCTTDSILSYSGPCHLRMLQKQLTLQMQI
jgi:hypothetical protein